MSEHCPGNSAGSSSQFSPLELVVSVLFYTCQALAGTSLTCRGVVKVSGVFSLHNPIIQDFIMSGFKP